MILTTWIHSVYPDLSDRHKIYIILNISHDKNAKYITLTSKANLAIVHYGMFG